MKIKKFKLNENSILDYNNVSDGGLVVKVKFSGEKEIPLNKIKIQDYYCENYSPDMTKDDVDNLLFYSLEQYIYENGVGGYSTEILDENGDKIDDIELYLNSKKYNL